MILWLLWTLLEIYICFNFIQYILYQYTDFSSYLPLAKIRLNELWHYSVKPMLLNFNYHIIDLWRNFTFERLYEKLYSFGCFIFMPLYNSYLFKSCKRLFTKYAPSYLPAKYLPIYLIIFAITCYLIYKLCRREPQRMRSHTQRHRSGLRAPRPHFPPDIEPFSDDEPDNEAEDISFNNIDDNGNSGSVDLSSYRNASHRSCPVCKHYEFNAVVLPCGHTALCLKCALKYYYHQRKCPVCQKAISTVHRIYL